MGVYRVLDNAPVWADAMLRNISFFDGTNWNTLQEGDFFRDNAGNWLPILRNPALTLGLRLLSGGTQMQFTHWYNDTLKDNPNIVIMGSSISISFNVPFNDGWQYQLQQYANANWNGATINNIGVAGEYTTHWLPTAQGGLADRNIDMALSFNPDIILLVGPTNDVEFNTPAQTLANLQVIKAYAEQRGAKLFLCSPFPRGSYNATQQAELAENNVNWSNEWPYDIFPAFNSAFRDKNAATAAEPDMTTGYFQGDETHLTATGNFYFFHTVIAPVLERELRATTAFTAFRYYKSPDSTNWTLYDTITDPQQISKTYTTEAGYYRVTGLLKDGTEIPFSNVWQVQSATISVDAGIDQTISGINTATLTATGTGPITGYTWTFVSGPTTPTIVTPNQASTQVTGMTANGAYVFHVEATDGTQITGDNTQVTRVAKMSSFALSKTPQSAPPGWINTGTAMGGSSDPFNVLVNVTDPATGFGIEIVATANWTPGAVGNSNAQDAWGATVDDGGGFFFPALVMANYWYMGNNVNFTPGTYLIRLKGLDAGKQYKVRTTGSRSNANGATGPYSAFFNLQDNVGNEQLGITNTFQNTSQGVEFTNKVPVSGGTMLLSVNHGAAGAVGHINGIQVEEI